MTFAVLNLATDYEVNLLQPVNPKILQLNRLDNELLQALILD
jgi:hypothetical protein